MQARSEVQMRYVSEQATCQTRDERLPLRQDVHTIMAVRTPEQTAHIALRGVLEAKGLYILKLEVWLKRTNSSASVMSAEASLIGNI